MFPPLGIALLEFCKDFLSRHTAGQQLLQHIFCFAFLCFFHCLCFGGSFFVFGFSKFLGGGFQFCFLGFQLRFQIIEICSQRSNLRFDFFLFSGLFCNDGCIINAGLYSTCLLYTSDAADEEDSVEFGGHRIIKKKNYKKNNNTPHDDNAINDPTAITNINTL